MKVRLITTIETVIDIDPGNTTELRTARAEIFGRLEEAVEQDGKQDQCVEAVKSLHSGCVVYDQIRSQSVWHAFIKVESDE